MDAIPRDASSRVNPGRVRLGYLLIPLAALCCLAPFVSSAMALILGMLIALACGNPHLSSTKKLTHRFLTLSVIGLGAGMDLKVIGRVGFQGLGYTVIGIMSTLMLGTLIGRLLAIERRTSLLVTVGTAICGGSAIAALAPAIRAKHHEVSIALGTVFLLNATALFLFPGVGHALQLSQAQFGLWSALAIHDTSSVVGATLQYGEQALRIGTTVKLARALWIAPVTFAIGWMDSRTTSNGDGAKPKIPWFILGFLATAAIVTWLPVLAAPGRWIEWMARRTLIVTLFLIGTNLTRETLKAVGIKPFIQGVTLWVVVASCALMGVLSGWIHE